MIHVLVWRAGESATEGDGGGDEADSSAGHVGHAVGGDESHDGSEVRSAWAVVAATVVVLVLAVVIVVLAIAIAIALALALALDLALALALA